MPRRFALLLGAAAATSALVLTGVTPAQAGPLSPGAPGPSAADRRQADLDVRAVPAKTRDRALRQVRPDADRAAQAWRDRLGDQAVVQLDPLTGTPRMLARVDGFLTGRSKSRARTVVLRYLRRHAAELGLDPADLDTLVLRRDYVDVAGIHHLSWTQVVGGVPAFGNGVKANVTKHGELISLAGAPISGLANQAAGLSVSPQVPAARARAVAADDVGGRPAAAGTTSRGRTVRWANHDQAQLVWFVTASGLRLAWSTYVQAGGTLDFQHVVDATSGAVLYRHDLVDNDRGDALVYENYPGAPHGGKQKVRDLVDRRYLPRSATTLAGGRYVVGWSDVNDDDQLNAGEGVPVPGLTDGRPQYRLVPFPDASAACSPRRVCTWDPAQGGSWRVNREADVTQGFYFASRFHDYLEARPFGFTRAAGSFEARDGDPVLLNALDGASTGRGDLPDDRHIDNANMSTPPDGLPPTMQMYLFHLPGATPAEDPLLPASSAFDASVILHEYTHGLSNRLVVDASGSSTLASLQAGAMGEAWSDYYAEDYLVHRGLERDSATPGEVVSGRYVTGSDRGIRTMPADCPVGTRAAACTRLDGSTGGYTYGELSAVIGFPEVHASGEVWAQTLWDLRRRLGHTVTGMLLTRGMELSPADPSFLDMRNAILQADLAVYRGKHTSALWRVFARRGMGFYAGTLQGSDPRPVQDFSRPPAPGSPRAVVRGTVTDDLTGAPVPGARVAVSGHDSGFGGDYTAITDAAGRYTIRHVARGRYPLVVAAGPGYVPVVKEVVVAAGSNRVDYTVRRDWAASSGEAEVAAFTGPDYSDDGCGPAAAIDLSLGSGWGSSTGNDAAAPTNRPVPKSVVVRLPAAVAVTAVAVDPGATCGDDETASTAGYRVELSADGKAWTTASTGTFTPADRGRLNERRVPAGPAVSFVRFTMLSPQVPDFATSCPAGDYSGCRFLDMTELVVYGRSSPPAADVRAAATAPR